MKTSFATSRRTGRRDTFGDFVCLVCKNFVSTEIALSGVWNRNHCPYCLSSRHLDLYEAGDRLSACKAPMRPIALTQKLTAKKYAQSGQGELMLVHLCTECGQASLNRIAADDDLESVYRVFQSSQSLAASVKTALAQNGVALLSTEASRFVQEQLWGRGQTLPPAALSDRRN